MKIISAFGTEGDGKMLNKKILSFILALLMLVLSFSIEVSADWLDDDDSDAVEYTEDGNGQQGDESDVTYDYTKAVSILKNLGIIDGKVTVNGTMTRAEFASEVITVLGLDVSYDNIDLQIYDDVDSSTLYSGAILACYDLNIMNGYGDGNFGPIDRITFGQAVKSIVCMLGYEVITNENATMADYLVIAGQHKLLRNTHSGFYDEVTGGEIAQILYNALEVGILSQKSTGLISDYETKSGDNLLDRHDIQKFQGVVYETSVTSINGDGSLRKGRVKIGNTIFDVNGTDIENYLGYTVKVYAIVDEYDNEDPKIVSFEVLSKNEIIQINDEDWLRAVANADLSKTVYYSEGRNEKRITVSKEADYIYQNVANPYFDITAYNPVNGYAVFIDNDGDGYFDVVSVKEYKTYIVEGIGTSKYNLNCDNGSISLDPQAQEYKYTITKNGVAADFAAIAVGDVVSLAEGTALDGTVYKEVNVSNTKIVGTVSEVSQSGNITYVTVGINETKALSGVADTVKAGMDGTFCLDFRGNIAKVTSSSGSYQYGYVIGIMKKKGISDGASLKILSQDGTIRVYNTKESVTLDGTGRIDGTLLVSGTNLEKIDKQVIQYKTNFDGEITEIITKENPTQDGKGGLALYRQAGITDASGFDTTLIYRMYNSNVPLFFIGNAGTLTDYAGIKDKSVNVTSFVGKDDTLRIDNSTLVFVVPLDEEGADDSNYFVNSKAFFKIGQFYYTEMFNVDEKTLTSSIVLVRRNSSATILSSAVPAMVADISRKIDDEGIEYYNLDIVDKSGARSIRISDELTKRVKPSNSTDSDVAPQTLKKGDVIKYTEYDGQVEKIERVLAYSANMITKSDNGNYRAEPAYTIGEVVRVDDKIVTIRYMYDGSYRIRHYNTSPVSKIVIYDPLGNGGKGEALSGSISDLELGDMICLRSSDGYVTSVFGFIKE